MARQPRRVRTEPKPGVDPTPQSFPATAKRPESIQATSAEEDRLDSWGDTAADSNDERLRDNVPPHNV